MGGTDFTENPEEVNTEAAEGLSKDWEIENSAISQKTQSISWEEQTSVVKSLYTAEFLLIKWNRFVSSI